MISHELIKAFLSVVEYGNLTAAANHTFVAQSNLSKQIKVLESEVGEKLLIRKKGSSVVTLTPYGEEFLRLAKEWQSIMRGMDDVKNMTALTEVSIGALDRINSFTFKEVYHSILRHHTDIRLDIHTRHSKEIYTMMESHELDLGYVNTIFSVHNLKITPLYYEPMLVIRHDDHRLSRIISPDELDPDMEIYSRWSDDFEVWHDQLWPGKRYRMHVGTSSMTIHYLQIPHRWAIVPVSTVQGLLSQGNFSIHSLSVEAPKRTIYQLEHKTNTKSREKAIRIFKDTLRTSLEKDPYIQLIYQKGTHG